MDNDDEIWQLRYILHQRGLSKDKIEAIVAAAVKARQNPGVFYPTHPDFDIEKTSQVTNSVSNKKDTKYLVFLVFSLLLILPLLIFFGLKYEFKGLPGIIVIACLELLFLVPIGFLTWRNVSSLGWRFFLSLFSSWQIDVCLDFYRSCRVYFNGLFDSQTSMAYLLATFLNIVRFILFHLFYASIIYGTILFRQHIHPFLLSKFFYVMLYLVFIISVGFFENSMDKKGIQGAIGRFLAPAACFAAFLWVSVTILFRLFFAFMLLAVLVMAFAIPFSEAYR